jgi:hypothetical protein
LGRVAAPGGCNQAHADANHGNVNSEAFLDFGGQISGRRADARLH